MSKRIEDQKKRENNGAWEEEKCAAHFTMKIQPSLKAKAEERAKELGRSMSNYVEWLIKEDLKQGRLEERLGNESYERYLKQIKEHKKAV